MTVEVKGIWLRRIGDRLQVLAETKDYGWQLVIDELDDGNISHIVEPPGILDAPLDPLSLTDRHSAALDAAGAPLE